jgi:PadR family transcriptional regulator, regulatory protein PadR
LRGESRKKEGRIFSFIRNHTGREAKFYSLTKKGRKHLEAEMASWERMSNAVALILRTAE